MSCFRDVCLPRGRWSLDICVFLFFFFLTSGPVSWQAEKETCLAMQYSDSVLHLTPKKNTCVFRSHPTPVICSPSVRTILAQWQEQGVPSEPFQQQATKVCRLPPASFLSLLCHAVCLLFETEDVQYLFSTCFYNGSLIFILNEALAYIFILAYEILVYHSMGCCACTSSTACRQ